MSHAKMVVHHFLASKLFPFDYFSINSCRSYNSVADWDIFKKLSGHDNVSFTIMVALHFFISESSN